METLKTATSEKTMWERIVEDPKFHDLPFTVETNENDQIILTAYKLPHSFYQSRISNLLANLTQDEGREAVEYAIQTRKGVKAPDVIWISKERYEKLPENAAASPVAPELCVEVLSESNTDKEMKEKRDLYFENGAREVWTCGMDGTMTFYSPDEQLSSSRLVPKFPSMIER